jgi:hypothetical protein
VRYADAVLARLNPIITGSPGGAGPPRDVHSTRRADYYGIGCPNALSEPWTPHPRRLVYRLLPKLAG